LYIFEGNNKFQFWYLSAVDRFSPTTGEKQKSGVYYYIPLFFNI